MDGIREYIFFLIEMPLSFFTHRIGHCIYYTSRMGSSFESSYILINGFASYLYYVYKKIFTFLF